MATTQANRLLSITTPLGDDVLLLSRLSGSEALSGPFRFDVELLAENDQASSVDPSAIVGQGCTISVALSDDYDVAPRRYFHGIVSRFHRGSKDDRFTGFRATIVPWTYLLNRKTNCRIFQNKSVLDVIKAVFDEVKGDFSDVVAYQDSTSATYEPVDYIVQYNETDFAFVSRLMEKEGIYYYFEFSDGGHKLVLGDDSTTLGSLPNQTTVRFDPEGGFGEREAVIDRWETATELRTGKYTQWDYNFQMPSKNLETSQSTSNAIGGNTALEEYRFPGEYGVRFNKPDERLDKVETVGRALTGLHQEELESAYITGLGSGNVRDFTCGYTFDLSRHPSEDGTYLLTSVQHTATQSPHYVSEPSAADTYSNAFTCQPSSLAFRPPRVTPKPHAPGVQRAVVVGPSGEEISTDKYGRIKVQFPWDREGENDENSSCWLRVAQPWAGQQWGAHFWPRIGHEVLVDFVNGDVNHPIVVGSLYHAENMPPYEMPDNQTRSGIKTRSTPDGDSENFNELRFEDKKDEEEIYFHAERDFNRVVENNDTLKVGFEKKEDGDQTVEIFNNQNVTIGDAEAADGSQTVEIFNNQNLTVGCAQASDGSQTVEIWKDCNRTIKTGNETVQIQQGDRSVTLDMGNDTLTLSMGNQTTEISMGNQTTTISLGKSETEAMQSIELKVGSSSIKVDQMGVTIKGMMIKVEGTMMTEVKGMMTQVKGDAMLKMQGGVTMIN